MERATSHDAGRLQFVAAALGQCVTVNPLFVLPFLGAEEDRKVHPGAERQDLRTARPPPHRPHREGPACGILAAGEGLTVSKGICVPPGRR